MTTLAVNPMPGIDRREARPTDSPGGRILRCTMDSLGCDVGELRRAMLLSTGECSHLYGLISTEPRNARLASELLTGRWYAHRAVLWSALGARRPDGRLWWDGYPDPYEWERRLMEWMHSGRRVGDTRPGHIARAQDMASAAGEYYLWVGGNRGMSRARRRLGIMLAQVEWALETATDAQTHDVLTASHETLLRYLQRAQGVG